MDGLAGVGRGAALVLAKSVRASRMSCSRMAARSGLLVTCVWVFVCHMTTRSRGMPQADDPRSWRPQDSDPARAHSTAAGWAAGRAEGASPCGHSAAAGRASGLRRRCCCLQLRGLCVGDQAVISIR